MLSSEVLWLRHRVVVAEREAEEGREEKRGREEGRRRELLLMDLVESQQSIIFRMKAEREERWND